MHARKHSVHARMDFTSPLYLFFLSSHSEFQCEFQARVLPCPHIGLSKSAYVSNGIGGAFGLMSTGSLLVASIATMGAFTVVTVGFSSDMDEWLSLHWTC